ncbi:helix-turn-helix domain-containing protein [Halorarius litoreus]|uniref:helix-turn-helix domain-containing protein n=1 Tax=Halorarius litoreus TaxID=2962676 RepID=UPI0020CCD158|nr:helix-turn-helix domain-containing protein [Halorarius litoreus]
MGTATARTQRLRVTVTPTKGWLHPLDRALGEAPGVQRKAFHGVRQLADESVITLTEVSGPRDDIETACGATDAVVSHSVSPLDDGWLVFAWIESTPIVERMLRLRRETGMVIEPPCEWTDRRSLRLDVVGPAARIQGAADSIQEDIELSVDPVETGPFGLSAEHWATLEVAVDAGYYASPRDTTVEGVATTLGTAPDATERRLREAESRLFAGLIAEAGD